MLLILATQVLAHGVVEHGPAFNDVLITSKAWASMQSGSVRSIRILTFRRCMAMLMRDIIFRIILSSIHEWELKTT